MAPRLGRSFALHVVSWYAGIPAGDVARAEGCAETVIRRARQSLGRGAELGLTARDALTQRPDDGQLSFADVDRMMRTNRSSCP